jgi:CheY-like chemotaxis protein
MQEALEMSGISERLIVAEDGEQALLYVRQMAPFADAVRPDLIFLDLNLPRRDGREVLAELKSDQALHRIPVIVLTTSAADRDVQRTYDLHANCYVRKPADFDRYVEVINACITFWLQIVQLPS